MAENAYIPFYASEWLAGTRGLTPSETGIYITLIAMMYERGEPLDMDDKRLARLCNCPTSAYKKAVETLVDLGKIEATDTGLWNDKVGAVLTKVSEKRDAARASANERWREKSNENNDGDMRTQCERNAIKTKTKRNISIVRFQEFWDAYPHRNGNKRNRKDAEKKYQLAVNSGVTEDRLIAAAKLSRNDKTVADGYARDPVTWLNQRGWEDEIRPVANSPQNSTNDQAALIAKYQRYGS